MEIVGLRAGGELVVHVVSSSHVGDPHWRQCVDSPVLECRLGLRPEESHVDLTEWAGVLIAVFPRGGLRARIVPGPQKDEAETGEGECSKRPDGFESRRQTDGGVELFELADRGSLLGPPQCESADGRRHDEDEYDGEDRGELVVELNQSDRQLAGFVDIGAFIVSVLVRC